MPSGSKRLPFLTQKPFIQLLPIYPSVVFVDWNGVLNNDVFWSGIRNNASHPLHRPLRSACEDLFRQPLIVKNWMKGNLTSQQIISTFEQRFGPDFNPSDLHRELGESCKRMPLKSDLIKTLSSVRRSSFVVLATDNMDCFYSQIDQRSDIRENFDSLLCSSVLGVLKAEDPKAFFGPWLTAHNLSFADAVLIDDAKQNCEAFRALGGHAIHVKVNSRIIPRLTRWQNKRENSAQR